MARATTPYSFIADAPIACHEIDSSGVIVYVNEEECRLLGLPKEEVLGREVWKLVASEEQEKSRTAVCRKLAGNQPLASFERDYVRPDGTRFTLEIYDKHICDENGRILGIRSFLFDITRRKITEQALQESEKRYRHLVDNASDIVYQTDINGRFVFFNPVATSLLGYREEELVGRSYLDLVRPDYRREMRAFYRVQLIQNTARTYFEFPAVASDGTEVWFGQNVQLIKEGDRTIGFQSITRDITRERLFKEQEQRTREELELRVKERTAELETANELLRREIEERQRAEAERRSLELQIQHAQRLESLGILAGGIAHDFNNLLTAIMGHASLALSISPGNTPASKSMEAVLAASRSAAELTQQMLAYSGRGKFMIEPISLSRLVDETGRFVNTLLSKKAKLRLKLASDPPPIHGDAAQIRQVLVNLLTNASDSLGDKPGVITIMTGSVAVDENEILAIGSGSWIPAGQYVFIEVTDTGCGMDQETLARIFDPFFTTKFTGRGLGLAAVLGIVRGHHGTLSVESQPGKGSTFRVLFPSGGISSIQLARSPQVKEAEWHGSGVVLVVDDEPTVRDVAAEVLSRAGLTVITAVDGPDAIRQFKANYEHISVVVLDLTMPGMDGIEVLQQINGIKPGLKVFLSSGYNLQDLDMRLAPNAVAGFLRKPYVPGELIKCMRAVIGAGTSVES